MAGQLAGPEQFLNDDAVIWKSNQIFNKSDPWGDVSQEASPFRFSERRQVAIFAKHPQLPGIIRFLLALRLLSFVGLLG